MEVYLLAGGENFSAFYNPKTKMVHTVHMDGVELVWAIPSLPFLLGPTSVKTTSLL